MTTPLAARIAREYGTPAAVIDMDRVERNIARVQAACDKVGLANRPHIKTHKSPMLARLQIEAGAKGITCQKLGEAEVMADAGIDDILISYNLLGEEKMARLGALQLKANMTVAANLNASATVGDSFSAPVQVVDSLGNTHTLTVNFTNTAPLTWKYDVTIPGEDLTGGTAGTPSSLTTGTLTFDSGGILTSPTAGTPINVATTTGLADGAADLNIDWNLFDSTSSPLITQYASASTTTGSTQDGIQAATVTGVSLQDGGMLVATFSNGAHRTLAQLAVASISNPDTLLAVNNNQYVVGVGTTTPSIGASGTSTRGNIVSGALEASNVDMATELTNLIVFQRGYQADSKAITAIDQMQQTLLAMNL